MSQRNSVFISAPADDLASDSDRRVHPRILSAKLPLTNARIPSVGPGSLVDLSAGGALIDLPFRVQPEARFALQLETAVERVELPFQLLRCYVAALDGRGPTYRVAGTFDSLLDVQALALRASSAVQQLVVTLERLRSGLEKSAMHSRCDAAFSDILGAVVTWLRRGESIDLVALKVKAHLTHQYPSLKILTSPQSSADDFTAVGGFGVTLKSRHQLSSYDRRFLRAHAQLLAMLEDTRRSFNREVEPPSWQPEVILSPAQWMTSRPSAGFTN